MNGFPGFINGNVHVIARPGIWNQLPAAELQRFVRHVHIALPHPPPADYIIPCVRPCVATSSDTSAPSLRLINELITYNVTRP